MADGARSRHPGVQRQLDRLALRSPGPDTLGLARITALLDRLGRPDRAMPPTFHVAGTNGKGSTTAFLRAMLEAAGHRVHAYTSPHLVRFNERIRLAGRLVDDALLEDAMRRVIDIAVGLDASFFEVTTAVAFDLFAAHPADACVVEVGLGGRLDATNVLERPAACGIASLGIDHVEYLLSPEPGVPADPLARVAFEKAGIAKPGVPLVTQRYAPALRSAIAAVAARRGALWTARDTDWHATVDARGGRDHGLAYRDAHRAVMLPLPALDGAYQRDNALLATAMIRHQTAVPVCDDALAAGVRGARWPARMQRLAPGPLIDAAGINGPVWLDGGHNVDAAAQVGRALADQLHGGAVALVVGMLANKDAEGFLRALRPHLGGHVHLHAVPVPHHAAWPPADLAALAGGIGWRADAHATLGEALAAAGGDGTPVAILGSLYLAGEVLRLNRQEPDWPRPGPNARLATIRSGTGRPRPPPGRR